MQSNKLKFPAWQLYLINFKDFQNQNISYHAKYLNVTYSHILKIVKMMEKNSWLEIEKVGRENIMKLTPTGEKISQLLRLIEKKYNGLR